MSKFKYTAEFEVNASPKMLYPYLSTPGGLAQWFAEDVTIDEDGIYNFIWDGDDHKAKQTVRKTNKGVKFEFLLDKQPDEKRDAAYFELKLEVSELTQSTFLKIVDYSENDDEEDLYGLWSNFVADLKEIVGG